MGSDKVYRDRAEPILASSDSYSKLDSIKNIVYHILFS